jgi:phosphatidylglycerophosphatase C
MVTSAVTSKGPSRIAIFDLDRTLIRCDSFPSLLNSLLLRNWWRLMGAVVASPVLLPLWVSVHTRTASVSALLWLATVGMRDEEWATAVSLQARRLASDTMNVVNRDGVRAIEEHQRDGDQVVLVTGSWCDLASALCNALGLNGVQVVGSTRRVRLNGWIADEHCVGERKVQMLRNAGVVPPWSVVYTDSASDLPLLHLAERRCVVNATPAALRTLNRELGAETVEVVQWK